MKNFLLFCLLLISSTACANTIIQDNPALLNLHACIAKANTGIDNCRIFFEGDSTTLGYGSHGTSGDQKTLSYPYQLAALYPNANIQSIWGDGMGTGICETSQYDSRLSVGTGWSKTGGPSGYTGPGGYVFWASSATGNLSFTPSVPVDTFIVYYIQDVTMGTFSYNLGWSSTNISATGTQQLASVTVTGTLGTNTLNLNWVSGGVGIVGIEAYDSSKKWIMFENAAWCGATAAQIATNTYPWSSLNIITTIAPGAVFIDSGINDWMLQTPISTYTASLQSMLVAWNSASVIFETPNPTKTTVMSIAKQNPYVYAIRGLATDNNLALIDLYGSIGSWANANIYGLEYDTYHNTAAGYAYQAQLVKHALEE